MQIVDSANMHAAASIDRVSAVVGSIAENYLAEVVEQLSYPRHFLAERESNRRACAWVAEEFRSLGYRVQKQGCYENIIALHPSCSSSPRILVGSHYDTVANSPGADDNASAVAVSLACARALIGFQERFSVAFVCFNREEDGLLGSKDYVEKLSEEEFAALRVVHILEMVGFSSIKPASQTLPEGLPVRVSTTGDFLAVLSNHESNRLVAPLMRQASTYCPRLHVVGVKTYLRLEKHLKVLLRSDHAPFWQAGIPALMWTDTSEFRNPNYHQQTDTARTLNYQFMKHIAQLLTAAILEDSLQS